MAWPAYAHARGRLAYRRGNAKFGADIWYSHGNGRGPDGDPLYHRVCEFKAAKDTEPMDRRTADAAAKAAEAAAARAARDKQAAEDTARAEAAATQRAPVQPAGKPGQVHPLVAELIKQQDVTLAQLGAAGCLEKAPALVQADMDPPTANAALAKLLAWAGRSATRAPHGGSGHGRGGANGRAAERAYAVGLQVEQTDGARTIARRF